MFAVVKTGGKQYRVSPGDVIVVEKLLGDSGDNITLSNVLMVGDDLKTTIGSPLVVGSVVEATIREQARGDKIIIFKKKRRQGYRRKKGHRQDITVLKINAISVDGHKTLAEPKAVMNPIAAEPIELALADTTLDTIPTTEKVVKKTVARKSKVDAIEPIVESVESAEPIKVSKPKKATTKSKKEQEA